jgi:nucleoid-associated protein YgaU
MEQEFPSAWSTASPGPAAPAFLAGPPEQASDRRPVDAPRNAADDDAPVPDFLASRAERAPVTRPRASRPDVQFRETVSREDLVPSWELTGQYGADLNDDRGRRRGRMDDDDGGGGDRFGGLIRSIAVIAILGLGVAGVILLPGLLAGGPALTPTPAITTAPTLPGSATPVVASSSPSASVIQTAEPTATPAPTATPRLYRVKSGDTLGRIAQRFKVSVGDILAANPEITDPDQIIPGQVIVIPPSS